VPEQEETEAHHGHANDGEEALLRLWRKALPAAVQGVQQG
jgi:hypothetical protein